MIDGSPVESFHASSHCTSAPTTDFVSPQASVPVNIVPRLTRCHCWGSSASLKPYSAAAARVCRVSALSRSLVRGTAFFWGL